MARVNEWARSTDSKAAPIFALQLGLVAILLTLDENLVRLLEGDRIDAARQSAGILAAAAYGLSAFLALVFAAAVYLPSNPAGPGSLIYFEDIGRRKQDDFIQDASASGPADLESDLLQQIYAVSKVTRKKMSRVRYAFISTLCSIACWAVLIGLAVSTGSAVPPGVLV